jgi:hypothetical protein
MNAGRRATLASVTEDSTAHVTLAGDKSGEYIITEERPDGTLVLEPDTSAAAILRRLGHEPASLEDFQAAHGPILAPDDEG